MERRTTLDPRSPLVLDTHELARRPGTMSRVQRSAPAPDDLGTEVIGIPPGSDLVLDLRLESVMEGVLVSGTVRAGATGECVRCLDEIREDVEVELQELYAYPDARGAAVVAEDDDEDPLRELEGDLIDLEPALRDVLVPALPFQPVCRPDCPGLCARCGARLADVGPEHGHEDLDPRWAQLHRMTGTQPTAAEATDADRPA